MFCFFYFWHSEGKIFKVHCLAVGRHMIKSVVKSFDADVNVFLSYPVPFLKWPISRQSHPKSNACCPTLAIWVTICFAQCCSQFPFLFLFLPEEQLVPDPCSHGGLLQPQRSLDMILFVLVAQYLMWNGLLTFLIPLRQRLIHSWHGVNSIAESCRNFMSKQENCASQSAQSDRVWEQFFYLSFSAVLAEELCCWDEKPCAFYSRACIQSSSQWKCSMQPPWSVDGIIKYWHQ